MALGKPVWVGSSIYNFEQIGAEALRSGVMWQALSPSEVLNDLRKFVWHADFVQSVSIGGFIHQRCGAVNILNELLFKY